MVRLSVLPVGGIVTLIGMLLITTAVSASPPRSISTTCGPATVAVACASGSADCARTTLTLGTKSGGYRVLANPRGLADYTAVAIACVSAKDGTHYISVQYGSLPEGCEFCEWLALYSVQGELLTHNDPSILRDDTLPEGHQQYPNNQQYSAISGKLGLTRPQFGFFPR